jgi:hypothetical protein
VRGEPVVDGDRDGAQPGEREGVERDVEAVVDHHQHPVTGAAAAGLVEGGEPGDGVLELPERPDRAVVEPGGRRRVLDGGRSP